MTDVNQETDTLFKKGYFKKNTQFWLLIDFKDLFEGLEKIILNS